MNLFKKILYIVLLVCGLGLLIGLIGYRVLGIVNSGMGVGMVIFASILGVLVYGYVAVVLHEFGHFIFGFIGGMKLKCIRFPFFTIMEVNGKFKVHLSKNSFFLGMCEMYPAMSSNPAKAFALMAIGGPIGSFVAFVFSLTLLLLAPYINGFLAIFFGLPVFIAYVILLENAFPAVINGARTDGAQFAEIIKGTSSSKVMIAVLTMQSAFRAGYSPQESPFAVLLGLPQLPEDDLNYLLLLNVKYLLALDKGDEKELIDLDKRLRDILPKIPDVFADQIIPDIFYDSLYLVPDANFIKVNLTAVFKQLEREDNVSACRIRGYYYFRVGDMQNAFREIEKGRSLAPRYALPGLAKMELRLLDELENKIAMKYRSFEE